MSDQRKGFLKSEWTQLRVFGHVEKNRNNRFEVSLTKCKTIEKDPATGKIPDDKYYVQVKGQYLDRDGEWRYAKGGTISLTLGVLEDMVGFFTDAIGERDKVIAGHYSGEQKPSGIGKKPGFLV